MESIPRLRTMTRPNHARGWVKTASTLGRCPACNTWVSDIGGIVGVASGTAANPSGAIYQTRCSSCQATLHAVDNISGDERRMDKEVTAADLRWGMDIDKPDRAQFISECGGLSLERCRWKDCEQQRINGLAFCYDHYVSSTPA